MQTVIAQPDLAVIKGRQQAAWSAGDYAVIGTTLQIVGESLCEALDLRAGQSVLDVAAGNGNATLAAARRWCDVVSTDYVGTLLERGRARAGAEGLDVRFEQADAENLPYPDGTFDAVLSTFGVMFTPNQEKAAAELARVCKRGGKIVIVNHFRSANPVLSRLDRWLSPLTVHIGFKSDLDLPGFIQQSGLRPVSIEKVMPTRLWTLLICAND